MSGSRVSVCIPTRNRSAFLAECIRSILDQTFWDFDLLVVDNGSTDDTRDVVARFRDPRIRYERNVQDVGMTQNWNRCIELAGADYVTVFHDDDLMMPSNLEEKVRILDAHPFVGMVASLALPIGEDGRPPATGPRRTAAGDPLILDHPGRILAGDVGFWPSTVLLRRSVCRAVGPFDVALQYLPDVDMWFRIAARHPVMWIDRYLVKYRGHHANTSRILAAGGRTQSEHEKLLRKHFASCGADLARFKRRAYFNMYTKTAAMYMYAGRTREARGLYLRALVLDPARCIGHPRHLAWLALSLLGGRTFRFARRLRHRRRVFTS